MTKSLHSIDRGSSSKFTGMGKGSRKNTRLTASKPMGDKIAHIVNQKQAARADEEDIIHQFTDEIAPSFKNVEDPFFYVHDDRLR